MQLFNKHNQKEALYVLEGKLVTGAVKLVVKSTMTILGKIIAIPLLAILAILATVIVIPILGIMLAFKILLTIIVVLVAIVGKLFFKYETPIYKLPWVVWRETWEALTELMY